VQAHLAALQERIEALEARSIVGTTSQHSLFGGLMRGTPLGSAHVWNGGSGHGSGHNNNWWWNWDLDYFDCKHMRLWSVVLEVYRTEFSQCVAFWPELAV
jgi:hypothetical protein